MFESELLQAHTHRLRELQDLRMVWADEIRTRGLVHWDDDAAAVQRGVVWQLNPGEDLRPKRHLSLILSEALLGQTNDAFASLEKAYAARESANGLFEK